MENQIPQNFDRNQEQQMLAEILENTRKTRSYIKWQMIITIALVVLPILGVLIIVPMILKSLSGSYGDLLM